MAEKSDFHVLIFSKTSGYRHDSIPSAIAAIKDLAEQKNRFTIEASEDAETSFTPSSLSRYAVIILLQCTGDFLSTDQLDALQHFTRAGGGIVAIHGAAVGMPNSTWYGALIGTFFDSHPKPETGTVLVEDADHWILDGRGNRTGWMDEWYNFRTHPRENTNLKILLRGDTKSFNGGKMGEDHPLVWCQEFEGSRSFYTALGHFADAYTDEWFMSQIFRAVLWAARRDIDEL